MLDIISKSSIFEASLINLTMENQNKGAGLSTANQFLRLIIEGKTFDWKEQYISGKQVRELGNAPDGSETFLAIEKPWVDERVGDDDQVDLARPGIEQFYFKRLLSLTINGQTYKWHEQYITGIEVRNLAGIVRDEQLFLVIEKPWEDEHIADDTIVDLARPGIEHFYSKKGGPKKVSITINQKPFEVAPGVHTVADLKAVGGVPLAHDLEQVIDGKLMPLKDDGKVDICGGEQFISHVKDGSSS
jgi:hypothetical protein